MNLMMIRLPIQMNRKRYMNNMNLPNKLTVLRIFMIPVFIIIAVAPFNWGNISVLGTSLEVTQLVAAINR